jgi:hypothetical protein
MRMVRIVGVLALLVVVVAIVMGIVQWRQFEKVPDGGLPDGFKGRVVAMEFVSSTANIDRILGPDVSHNRQVMETVLMIDFVWIICYALLYISISVLLMGRNCPWARYLGFLALLAGVAAAVFDFLENVKIIQAMNYYEQSLVNSVNDAALLKWTFGFVAIALLAIAFQDLESRLAYWISISFIVAAVVGFAGLWNHQVLALAFLPLLIGLILLIFTALARPHALRQSGC